MLALVNSLGMRDARWDGCGNCSTVKVIVAILKTNSMANGKPMQIRKNRCDATETEPRFLGDQSSKSILDKLKLGESDLKQIIMRADRIMEESTCLGILPITIVIPQNTLQSAMNSKTEISIVKSSILN